MRVLWLTTHSTDFELSSDLQSSTVYFLNAVSVCCHHVLSDGNLVKTVWTNLCITCRTAMLRWHAARLLHGAVERLLAQQDGDENMWHLYTCECFGSWMDILKCTFSIAQSAEDVLLNSPSQPVSCSIWEQRKVYTWTTYTPNHKPTACIVYIHVHTMLLSCVSSVIFIGRVAFVTRQHWGCAACCWTHSGAGRGRCLLLETLRGMAGTILDLDESVAAMYLFVNLQKYCNAVERILLRDHRHLPESFDLLKPATIQEDDLPPLISHEPVVMEDAWLPEEKEDEA